MDELANCIPLQSPTSELIDHNQQQIADCTSATYFDNLSLRRVSLINLTI